MCCVLPPPPTSSSFLSPYKLALTPLSSPSHSSLSPFLSLLRVSFFPCFSALDPNKTLTFFCYRSASSMKARMCSSGLLKQEFLKKWIKGLHLYNKVNMGILDRKKAIKLSADVAIASTRKAATHWSQALMDDIVSSSDGKNRILVEHILGHKAEKNNNNNNNNNNKASTGLIITCSKRILRRSHVNSRRKATRVVPRCVKPSSIARKIVKKKTRVLKSLVPGGENMDGNCFIQETLDYIVSLRVQVDVMRFLVNTAERLEP